MQTMTNDTTNMMAAWRMSGGAAAAGVALCVSGDEMLSTSAISTNNSFSCLTGGDERISAHAMTGFATPCLAGARI